MFFFPDKKTPVLFQGITSDAGQIYTQIAQNYGTKVVAGISADFPNTLFNGIPLFSSVKQAVRQKKPKLSVIFSTPQKALTDVLEAINAKIPLIICTTEHVPMHDSLKMQQAARKNKVTLLGPSSAGILNVENCLTGTLPTRLFKKGNIALVGRSSSLMFEAVQQLQAEGFGVSKCVSLGADHLIGTSFAPVIEALYQDKETKAILIIGQVHGTLEYELANLYNKKHPKPLFVYIPGKSIVRSDKAPLLGMKSVLFSDIIQEKKKALAKAVWIDAADKIGKTISNTLKGKKK